MNSTALSRHPTIHAALALARRWCVGRIIDDAPALAHAVKVAATLHRHVPDPDPLNRPGFRGDLIERMSHATEVFLSA
jgi:hypothetical protein